MVANRRITLKKLGERKGRETKYEKADETTNGRSKGILTRTMQSNHRKNKKSRETINI